MFLGQNVLAHGADPTGSTDSTAAFIAAMNALPSGGGIVCIPAGRYRIDLGPLTPARAVYFLGEGGAPRTGGVIDGAPVAGSVSTLIFPSNSDGFDIGISGVRIENLAIIRTGSGYARRGIYARRTFYAENLYLLRWERGIDLDGRPPNNVNGFRIENIFAEDCAWATYTRGYDAQGGRFKHIYCFQCEAGIYDSSLAGNGYADCYVEHAAGATGIPFYIDNQSQLRNCRCEATHPAQIAFSAQVSHGTYNPSIVGLPARIDSAPFATSGFSGDEQITVAIDGTLRTVTFTASDQNPAQVASRINDTFSDLGVIATVDIFDSRLILQGRVPHVSGSIAIDEVGTGGILPAIGFSSARSASGMNRAQVISTREVSGVVFRAISGPSGAYGDTEQIEVQLAFRGDVALLWQARGDDADYYEHTIIRDRDPHIPTRRWAFARAASLSLKSLAFTHDGDELGADQLLSYRGFWLYKTGASAVLLSNGAPDPAQGRDGDYAWDMVTSPPTRYQKSGGEWLVAP